MNKTARLGFIDVTIAGAARRADLDATSMETVTSGEAN